MDVPFLLCVTVSFNMLTEEIEVPEKCSENLWEFDYSLLKDVKRIPVLFLG